MTGQAASKQYKDFGEFLNAVLHAAVADFGLNRDLVRGRMDFWLDRFCFAEYCSKCASGKGCTTADVQNTARAIDRAIKDNLPFPEYE